MNRVRMKYDPRIWNSAAEAHAITGTIIERRRIGFDVRVKWDDGRPRGRYGEWMSWQAIEESTR